MSPCQSLIDALSGPVVVRESDLWSYTVGARSTDRWAPTSARSLTGKSLAIYSPCMTYRYLLTRQWNILQPRALVFVGLNPSTATENVDDPTIRRLIGFTERWGLGGLTMLNYFAFRSTDPNNLPDDIAEASGPLNDEVLDFMLGSVKRHGHELAFGWGTNVERSWRKRHKAKGRRFREVRLRIKCNDMGIVPKCFDVTQAGYPKHPLYLSSNSTLIDYPW